MVRKQPVYASGRLSSSRPEQKEVEHRETVIEQISSFVAFFIYLLVLKSYLLPLFIIPTGSMAETLYGAHAKHVCPNCGVEYPVGMPLSAVPVIQCPNCRWREFCESARVGRAELPYLQERGVRVDGITGPLHERAGDRIMVHGWTYEWGGRLEPQRWDVAVFKVPSDGHTNYIKRLIGKPGETIEIIDGDIFVTDPETGATAIARKPRHVQEALWFLYYDHDYLPRRPAPSAAYHPRWVSRPNDVGWSALDTRRPMFDGLGGQRGEIQFVTNLSSARQPGEIADIYGYDRVYAEQYLGQKVDRVAPVQHATVTDVRLSTVVTFEEVAADGYVELAASKYSSEFYARLYGDGRLTLERAPWSGGARELWGSVALPSLAGPVRLALSNVDYVVSVEVDGRPVLTSTSEQYGITAAQARERLNRKAAPRLRVAAENVKATFAHLLIERDVHYLDPGHGRGGAVGYGGMGNPIVLGPDEYYVLGDNSPSSLDSRYSFANLEEEAVGAHLRPAFQRGEYRLGTVPADQLIGPAFLVYWPGTAELVPDQMLPRPLRLINQLPTPGGIRWIH